MLFAFMLPVQSMQAYQRNGCYGRLIAKNFNHTLGDFGAELGRRQYKLSLLKFLPLIYHHSHFLAATSEFTLFITLAS